MKNQTTIALDDGELRRVEEVKAVKYGDDAESVPYAEIVESLLLNFESRTDD